jgi:hypothetical protein
MNYVLIDFGLMLEPSPSFSLMLENFAPFYAFLLR